MNKERKRLVVKQYAKEARGSKLLLNQIVTGVNNKLPDGKHLTQKAVIKVLYEMKLVGDINFNSERVCHTSFYSFL